MIDFNALAADIGHCLDQALSPDALPDVPASLLDPMRYALLGGGKRIRPILCVLSAEAAGGSAERAMPAALAIETLHNYTLVHDDLPCMDDDLLRRGRPTVHAKYGYAQAVLVGDALQAAAFALALTPPNVFSRRCRRTKRQKYISTKDSVMRLSTRRRIIVRR